MESCNMEEMMNLMMEPAVPVLDLDRMDLHITEHDFTGQNRSSVVLQLPFTATASSSSSSPSSRGQIISFANPAVTHSENPSRKPDPSSFQYTNLSFLGDEEDEDDHGYKQQRSPKQAQFHALAERNRRNKLRDYFISLSRVVPGIRKLDKSTILEDATNHIKELEGQIMMLEKGTKENLVNHTCNVIDVAVEGELMPEIKVVICERDVLIKILCDKNHQSSVLLMLEELKKLHLIISSTNVLKFGDCAIDITFGAQMGTHFSASVKDIISHLREAIFQVK